jgi:hypothetical protein
MWQTAYVVRAELAGAEFRAGTFTWFARCVKAATAFQNRARHTFRRGKPEAQL